MAADPDPPIGEDELHAFVDGALEPARLAAVRLYLAERPAEAERVRAFAAQRDALRAALAFKAEEPIPARLRLSHLRAARRGAALARGRAAAAAALLLLAGAGLGWTARGSLSSEGAAALAVEPATLHRAAVAEGVPSPEARAGETDIPSWLAARLGDPMPVPDLSAFGLSLEAAWLLPGADGPSAVLRYAAAAAEAEGGGGGTAVTLWRRPTRDPVPRQLRCADEPGGLVTYTWSDGHRLHAVTAAMPRDRLRPIALAVERATRAASQPGGGAAVLAGLAPRPCDARQG